MWRMYQPLLESHLSENDQMLFLAGPRQVGKTTLSQSISSLHKPSFYFNWDLKQDRKILVEGALALGEAIQIHKLTAQKPLVIFDEIHKFRSWKTLLKGFYDIYKGKVHIIVTGSAKLNIYRKGGDSLMGRYFLYRIHPLSIRECAQANCLASQNKLYSNPVRITDEAFNALWEFGGFPDPYLKRNAKFFHKWQGLREEQLFREDVRDLTQIQEIALLEMVAEYLKEYASERVHLSHFAQKIGASVNTMKRWFKCLEMLYYSFTIPPWTKNIARSLTKDPKIYLWDWSQIVDVGKKSENFVACHLLKAIHFWQDSGLGKFGLFYIRDKDKNEVDFLITENKQPWCLVEVKYGENQGLSKQLYRFQKTLHAPYAFQVVIDMEYVDVDCFQEKEPKIVPAKTFLSQLV